MPTTIPQIDNILLSKALTTVKVGKTFSCPLVIILMGLPGSGKTYVANSLNKKYGFTILSGENISHLLYGNNPADFSLVYKILRQLACHLLNDNHSIVIDGTNLKFSHRQQIYQEVCSNLKTILIYLLVDDQTARQRIDLRGVSTNHKQDIKSSVPPEVFAKFKQQTDEPKVGEFCFKINSDVNLLKEIDFIISHLSA